MKLAAIALLAAAATSTAHASVVAIGEPYVRARQALTAAGWKATDYALDDSSVTPEGRQADEDLRASYSVNGMPEVGSCFPTGLGQCFAVWRKVTRLLVVELPSSDSLDTSQGPRVYFYYQVQLHHRTRPQRRDWDLRSADIIPGSHPKWRRQW